MGLLQDDKQVTIVPIAIFFIFFGACMNIKPIIKAKILFLLVNHDLHI